MDGESLQPKATDKGRKNSQLQDFKRQEDVGKRLRTLDWMTWLKGICVYELATVAQMLKLEVRESVCCCSCWGWPPRSSALL